MTEPAKVKKPRKKAVPKSGSKEMALNKEYSAELKLLINSIERAGYVANLSGSNGSDQHHSIYDDFGYPSNPTFSDYFGMYDRFGPATAAVDLIVEFSWLNNPKIESKSERFNSSVLDLIKQTKLWNRSKGLDSRQRVGRYAGMLVEVRDSKELKEPMEPLSSLSQIINLKPIYEGQLTVETTDSNQKSDNYGNPTMYNYNSSGLGDRNSRENLSGNIHPTRLIMQAEGADDGSIYGVSVVKNILNDLINLQKISGASGEGFYQNTRNAPVITADKEFQAPATEAKKKELENEIDEFLNKWRKKFVSKGLTFNYPNIKLDNPKDHADNCWNNIAAGVGVSSSELRGTQTGVLAGDKDNKSTMVKVKSRRENFLTEMVRDIIDWFIRYSVLENVEYEVVWDELKAATSDEKATVAGKLADINTKQASARVLPAFSVNEIREAAGYEPLEEAIELLPALPPPDNMGGGSEDFIGNLLANLKKKPEINAEDEDTLKDDPTKTLPIRKKWESQFGIRYRKLKGRVNKLLLKGDEGEVTGQFINPETLATNQFVFTSDPQSVVEFMAWLDAQVQDLLFTDNATPIDIWQNQYIDDSYLRGINRTDAEIRSLGITAQQIEEARAAQIVGTATPSLTSGAGLGLGTKAIPIHLDAIQLLYIREFQALKGITDEMSKQIARVLVEGVEQGLGVRDMAKLINDRVDKIGLTRSRLIARTESVRAYNIATINEGDALAEELGIKPMYEWVDSSDSRVRETHEKRDGNIYTAEEAMKLIGEPNCRCSLKLVFIDEDGNKI